MLTQFNHARVKTGITRRDPAVHSLLAHARPCALSFYPPSGTIYAQGEPVGPLYLVEFGTVRICRHTADGRRQISAFHADGDVFGFEPGREHENYAECVDRTGIRLLRPGLDKHQDANLLSIALRTLARTQDHLMVLGRMSASERMAAFLLDQHARQRARRLIDLPMQRHDIADYLCLTIETVSRVLRIFKDAGLIRLPSAGQIAVLDLAGLQHMAP